jgi:predicted permease
MKIGQRWGVVVAIASPAKEAIMARMRAGNRPSRLDFFAQDLVSAHRALRQSRGHAAWVVGSLALGMAVTIAALALLNAELLLPFPAVADQHRLVRVSVSQTCVRPDRSTPDCWTRLSSPADYLALRGGLDGVQGLAAYTPGEIAVALPEARSMRTLLTSENYFDVLGVRPALGRTFSANDAATHAPVAVIADALWTREFAADPSVVGRSIRIADEFVEIIGVAPPLFAGVDRVRPGVRRPDVWLPMWLAPRVLPPTAIEQRRQGRDTWFVGRLKEGAEVRTVQAEANVLARRLASPSDARADVRRVWRVNPEHWHFALIIVMPIPILVLAIACVNAANLMLARGSQRQREMAIRLAIGAGRARIIRQLLLESALLALAGTAIAVPMAWWGLDLASRPLGGPIPIDPTVLALTILTAAVTTVAFGLAPAVRVSAERPSSTLGTGGARDDAPPHSRMRRALVLAQVALSLGLLATSWQFVSTVRAQAVSAGTPADRLLVARFNLQPLGMQPGEIETFYRDLVDGAMRLPGVDAAGVARHTSVWTFGQDPVASSIVVWLPADLPDDGRRTIGGYAGGDLLGAIGLRLIAGRGFTDADRLPRPQVAVVNQTFADSMTAPALGSLIRVAPRGSDFTAATDVRIVGVIEPALEPRLAPDGPPAAKVYLPSPIQPEPALALYVRTRAVAATVAQPLRELVNRLAPRVPIQELGSLQDLNERSYAAQLWLARGAAWLGVIGLLLATAGLYGVSSYVVAMRSREMAIRIAIGATPSAILTMILGQSMRVAAVGVLAGGASAIVVSRYIQSEYHGIQGIDGAAFGGAIAMFLVAMLFASAIPAVRASRVDPVENLKDA